MKKIVCFLLLILTLKSSAVNACDKCACALNNSSFGILPLNHKNFIGLQYIKRSYTTKHTFTDQETIYHSREEFQSLELRSKFQLAKRLQWYMLVPTQFNKQYENNTVTNINGLGDIATFFNYTLLDNGDSINLKWKQNVQLGAGMKLATGKYQKQDENNILNPNLQSGTGSYDLIFDAIYTIRYKKWGIHNTALYRWNTANPNRYKFGNRLSTSHTIFYWTNIRKLALLPSIGVSFEKTDADTHNKFIVENSGGTSINATAAMDFYYKRWTLGANVTLPLHQQNPVTNNKINFGTTLYYAF